jgi:hypothetical protein
MPYPVQIVKQIREAKKRTISRLHRQAEFFD